MRWFFFNPSDAQSDVSSLETCRQIKSMCPKVKSGYYWLRGVTETDKINMFYCDMETDSVETQFLPQIEL